MDPVRTLVTGFGPFGDVDANPSSILAEGCGRPFHLLEVSYLAVDRFLTALDPASFDRLLMIGIASRRHAMTPELYGRNVIGRAADVRGLGGAGVITPGGPSRLPATLWSGTTWPTGLRSSLDAGTYLCNFALYRALELFPAQRVGFLHVPPFRALAEVRQQAALAELLVRLEAR